MMPLSTVLRTEIPKLRAEIPKLCMDTRDVSSRNSISYTYDIGLSASYELLDNLTLDLTLDYVAARNIYNVKGQNASDFQVILGVSYRPF